MSRWWAEQVDFYLPGPVDPPAGLVAEQRVRLALADFNARLEGLNIPRRARLRCIVGSALARYAVVPWNPALAGRRSRQHFAEHCLQETYGEPARAWRISVDPGRHGQPTLACAVDAALVDGLQAAAERRQLRLTSLQPALMHGFNRQHQRPVADSHWCRLLEPGAATLLLMQQASPRRVLVTVPAQAEAAMVRESFALGLEPAPRVVELQALAP